MHGETLVKEYAKPHIRVYHQLVSILNFEQVNKLRAVHARLNLHALENCT